MSEWSITFAADRLDEFHRLMSKTNKRLAKAGAPTFAPVISAPFDKLVSLDGGLTVAVPHVTATFAEYRLALGDYTFVAALVPEEAGWVIHTAPGQSLDGWKRPDIEDRSCDHCQVDRRRVRLYVVRDDKTGELIQLGHSCISLYTGLEPKGLFALTFDAELREFSERDEFGSLGGGSRDFGISIDTVLALSFAYSQGGRAYVSKARADEWDKPATVDLIREHLFCPPKPASPGSRGYEEFRAYMDKVAEAAEIRKDEVLLEAIKASAETLAAGSDYGDNMRIILAAESGYVGRRSVGVLASLVAVYRRGLEQEESRKAQPPAEGFLGEVGERIKDVEVTAKVVKLWEGYYGMTTFLVGATDSGHTLVWKASGRRGWEPGDRIKIIAATVKAHEQFQGTDQTVITRARVG